MQECTKEKYPLWQIYYKITALLAAVDGADDNPSAQEDLDLTVYNSTPIILKKTKLRLQNPVAEVAYSDNDLKGSGNIEDLDTAESVSGVFVRSNNIKDEIINSLEEKNQEFNFKLSIPKSSKTEILSEKED